MTYQQAIDYLYSRLPVFHRDGVKAIKPGLFNIQRLCDALGNPQKKFRSIHVAGTNGKGSCSHMLAAIYQQAGYKVGLYTSPHLKSFTERFRIGGVPIPESDVAGFVRTHQALIEAIQPSFFEVTVALAFAYFARETVDIAVIEVGLGGRLDSTNIIEPALSVITNIGFDHTETLGHTLALIAGEKAGIIKPQKPVVIGQTQPETEAVFRAVAARCQAPIYFANQLYQVQDRGLVGVLRDVEVLKTDGESYTLRLDLAGQYQCRNIPAVLASVEVLQPVWPVLPTDIQTALAQVQATTGLRGRFQILQQSPMVIADTAHNPDGLRALFETVLTLPVRHLYVILGMVADKDVQASVTELPSGATYYVSQASGMRALDTQRLLAFVQARNLNAQPMPDVHTALETAIGHASAEDVIVITGSTYFVAELTNL